MTSSPLRAVLVGCGNMSQAWLGPAMKIEGLSIVGLVDINRQVALQRAAQYGLKESVVYASLAEAIRSCQPDVVFDVTIPAAHKAVTLEALSAGCHVLGEKPMSDKLQDARIMVKAAQDAGKIYAVIQNRRYEPGIRRVKQAIENGMIGQLAGVYVDFFLGPHFGGFRDEMDYPLLVDMAIHTFDQARYLSQADPVSVYCHAFNPSYSWYKGDASSTAIFEMTGGLVYVYRGSWCAQGQPTSWEGQWRITGSRGTILWPGDEHITAQVLAPNQEEGSYESIFQEVPVPQVDLAYQTHEGLLREFVDCVRAGRTPLTHCQDNIKSLAMVFAAVESAKTGQKVSVVW